MRGVSMKNSAGKAGTWHYLGISTWLATAFLAIVIGVVSQFALLVVWSVRLPRMVPSMAEYGAISMQQHAIRSSSAVKLESCLRIGRGSLLYCGLVLLWVWPVALSGVVSATIGLPVAMNISKVSIVIVFAVCTYLCSCAVGIVIFAYPRRRLEVFRFWAFVYHVFLRCGALLLFVKAK